MYIACVAAGEPPFKYVGAAQISPDMSWLRLSNRAQGFDELLSPAAPAFETARFRQLATDGGSSQPGCEGKWSGNLISNTLPFPFSDTTQISPFKDHTSSLTIANPNPAPGISSPAARSNSPNTRSWSSKEMPSPVSDTRRHQRSAPSFASAKPISPDRVYFMALEIRFTAICLTLNRFKATKSRLESNSERK